MGEGPHGHDLLGWQGYRQSLPLKCFHSASNRKSCNPVPSADMQCATAARSCAAPAAPTRQQQPTACLRAVWAPCSQRSQQRQQLAAQPLVQQRRCSSGSGGRRGLAVCASLNYGAEWSTPQDAYLTVVRGHTYPTLTLRCAGPGGPGRMAQPHLPCPAGSELGGGCSRIPLQIRYLGPACLPARPPAHLPSVPAGPGPLLCQE